MTANVMMCRVMIEEIQIHDQPAGQLSDQREGNG